MKIINLCLRNKKSLTDFYKRDGSSASALLRANEDHGAGAGLVDADLVSKNNGLLLRGDSETSGEAVLVHILDYGIDVLARLSWDFLAAADAYILNQTALKVMLEELPNGFGADLDMRGKQRGDPYAAVESLLA